MKVLIAEDTADLNRVVTVMLQKFGYEVDSVFDGADALEQLERNGYDAVILDTGSLLLRTCAAGESTFRS